jgi:hypothetical protein
MTTPVPVVVALRSRRAAAVAPSRKSSLAMSALSVQLRPFQETDLELLDRFADRSQGSRHPTRGVVSRLRRASAAASKTTGFVFAVAAGGT